MNRNTDPKRATVSSCVWFAVVLGAACTAKSERVTTNKSTSDAQPQPQSVPQPQAQPLPQIDPTPPLPALPEPPKAAPFAIDDREAVRQALAAATGRKVDEDTCIEWAPSFPRVVAIGSFASDRGCMPTGLFVDRTYLEEGGQPDPQPDAVISGLATRGFVEATPEVKQTLARAWVDDVVHAFESGFVGTAGIEFSFEGVPKFVPVATRTEAADTLVEGWVQEPPGMADERSFDRMLYRFASDGRLSAKSVESFSIEGQRIRDRERGTAKPTTTPTTVTAIDMSRFKLTCKHDDDCTNVRPSPCGACGCDNTPLAARDLDRFREAASAITCPPTVDLGISCGGCPGYLAYCKSGTCAVKTH